MTVDKDALRRLLDLTVTGLGGLMCIFAILSILSGCFLPGATCLEFDLPLIYATPVAMVGALLIWGGRLVRRRSPFTWLILAFALFLFLGHTYILFAAAGHYR